jgi:hypothetical protein
VIVPGDEVNVMLFPKLSDKAVDGNAVKFTVFGPAVSPGATSNKMFPSPTENARADHRTRTGSVEVVRRVD